VTKQAELAERDPFPRETAAQASVAIVQRGSAEVIGLLQQAIDKGVDVEALEKLLTLHERVADRAAAQEFAGALAAFQAECPPIRKTSKAEIATRSGTRYSYQFASLDHIAEAVNPLLSTRGLSYTWDSETTDGSLRCVCTLRHVNGHSIQSSFACPLESKAGMSEQQKVAAALSYARRQSLTQVLGLTTTDPDTDAASTETITEEQVANLESLMSEVGADRARFLSYLKVDSFDKLPESHFTGAIRALEAKRARP